MPEPLVRSGCVSVVVSTYNRPARLARLLDSLAAQTLRRRPLRGGGRRQRLGARRRGACWPPSSAARRLALRTVRHPVTLGPAGGRNAGWRLARAPLVAFTDDDCAPVAGWLAAHAGRRAPRVPGAIIQGPTRPDPAELAADGPALAHGPHRAARTAVRDLQHRLSASACSSRSGGFDESFGLEPAGEDTDLAWRAIEAGLRHGVRARRRRAPRRASGSGSRGMLRVAARWSAVTRVFRDHPQTAHDALPGRVLERLALPAVALAAGAGRRRPGCAGCCWRATCASSSRARPRAGRRRPRRSRS